MTPTVSVLITAFNRAPFLGDAIESALDSSIRDIEVIVCDDASTDGTASIAEAYALKDERVRVHRNEVNIGDYPNRNRAASLARSRYLKYLDSDDVIYQHGLEVMVRSMDMFPTAGLGLSAAPHPDYPFPFSFKPADAYRDHFFGRGLLGRAPGSAIIRRDAFESVGGFSGIRQVGDHELWLKLAARFDVVAFPAALVWDRDHPQQEKHFDDLVTKILMHNQVEVAALLSSECPLPPAERELARTLRQREHSRTFWRLLTQVGRSHDANRLRKELHLTTEILLAALLQRFTRTAQASPPST